MSEEYVESQVKIWAVIVLYRCRVDESAAFRSLRQATESCRGVELKTLIFDNSPGQVPLSGLPRNFIYVKSPANEGLSGAYNYALKAASTEGYEWLLTLDQDTTLPNEFFLSMSGIITRWQHDKSVAAIVPQLTDGAFPISPVYVRRLRSTAVPLGFSGLAQREVYALNSAALLRIAPIQELGGFSREFRLDQLDLWLHHHLYRAGMRVFIAGSIRVEHKLSLLDYETLSPARFRAFLEAESVFFDLYRGFPDNLFLTATLLVRFIKLKKRDGCSAFSREVYRSASRRILLSKKLRVARWKAQFGTGFAPPPGEDGYQNGPDVRPQVSVCMAAYNGSRFILEQIQSILIQLGPMDELIIVDDCSSDETCRLVESLGDNRIHLIRHDTNRGVARSFEDALLHASGRIIFFSDQDDIWLSNKVSTVLGVFRLNPDVTMVVSDAWLVDQNGTRSALSYYSWRGSFKEGIVANLVRCKYLGCTMAFRAELLEKALPFPSSELIFHDVWLGMVNRLLGHRTYYLTEPLVCYRRHGAAVTGNRTLSIVRRAVLRLHLLCAAVRFRVVEGLGDYSRPIRS